MTVQFDSYDELLKELKNDHKSKATNYIPKLCRALRDENENLSNEDITERVKKDLIDIWSRTTIYENIPDEFKNKERQKRGSQSHKNVSEQLAKETGPKLEEPIQVDTSGKTVNEPQQQPTPQPATTTNYDDLEDLPDHVENPPEAQQPKDETLASKLKDADKDLMELRKQNEEFRLKIHQLEQEQNSIQDLRSQIQALQAEKQTLQAEKNKLLTQKKKFQHPPNIKFVFDDGIEFEENIVWNKMAANQFVKAIHEWLAKYPQIDYFLIQGGGPHGKLRINIPRPEFLT